jgi:hypothetical protein
MAGFKVEGITVEVGGSEACDGVESNSCDSEGSDMNHDEYGKSESF